MGLTHESLRLEALARGTPPDCGALAVFAGVVRNHADGRAVRRLCYTAYAPVAEALLAQIETEVCASFRATQCRIEHRLGSLEIGDIALFCAVHAPHRAEAFAALRAAVDAVKHRVPIWKEEFYEDGDSAFVQGCCIAAEEPCAQQTLRVHWYDPHAGCEETHTP